MTLQSVYYIAGNMDINGNLNAADEAQEMYDLTAEPRKITIFEGESMHGTDLLAYKSLVEDIKDWINVQLPI